FGDLPWLFENLDLSLGINLADKMQPSGSQWQRLRDVCDLPAQQLLATQLSGGLLDGQSAQRIRSIVLVPGEELRALAVEITPRGEMILVPEAFGPSPVDPFDHVIALRFTGRHEEQFEAEIQSQAHEPSEDSGSAPQAGKSGVVIKLQQVRQAQL